MDGRRDRDYDGVPDWQEEANYADEAPIRGNRPVRGGGCPPGRPPAGRGRVVIRRW